jgi:1,4-alpha-glucan branching enzyme
MGIAELFLTYHLITALPVMIALPEVPSISSKEAAMPAIEQVDQVLETSDSLESLYLANVLTSYDHTSYLLSQDPLSEINAVTGLAQSFDEASLMAANPGDSENQAFLLQLWEMFKHTISDGTQAISEYFNKVLNYFAAKDQDSSIQTAAKPPQPQPQPFTVDATVDASIWEIPALQPTPEERKFVVSPDVDQLHLAAIDVLDDEPQLSPDSFEPMAGPRFNEDGSVTLRVLVGNTSDRLHVIGDFNYWGKGVNLARYELQPSPGNPLIHEITLPPGGNYHKAQYRFVDQNGRERLDMTAPVFSTPAFNERFYNYRADNNLNAVLWKSTPIPAEEQAEEIDLRGKPLVILETDIVSLSLNWNCSNPDSPFFGQKGSDNISQLYKFVGECGLPEKLADLGYNTIQFMPLDTHVDFWEPGAAYFPDWRYSYQTINFYGKQSDFGSPDELRAMVNDFHQAGVAVVLDVVYSHYSDRGNNPPRDFGPLGFSQYKRPDGWELYGGPWTEWGTRRFTYSPEIRRNIVDAALINLLDYGFDGLRIDNVNGIDYEPYGRDLLREISEAVKLYRPESIVIGEGYFGDPYLNRALDYGGAGLTTTYCDRFYLWFTEDLIKHRQEIDTWRLDYMLNKDWHRALLYYPGNHDEFANPGNPFQARGRYLVDAINGGDFHNRKIQSWSALDIFASSYYLDMFQLWTMQPGNLNSNSAIEWNRLDSENVAQVVNFQKDMKKFFVNEPAFAPYNMHRHMVHWIDHDNKVIVFERIDFETGKRVYAVVNLGDQQFENYKIPVYPEDAKFALALDSDNPLYGGADRNPAATQAENHEVSIFLGSYGVVGLVQQDKITPVEPMNELPVEVRKPDHAGYRRMFFNFK